MTGSIIEAKNVSKVLGNGPARVQALKDVSLTLNGGELTVLMGPSGSGKTTLLSILGCMLAPTDGTVRVCGASTSGARAEELAKIRRQHIGFVSNPIICLPPSRSPKMFAWRSTCAGSTGSKRL
jgi:putative ABC transport system ATP-binding protein